MPITFLFVCLFLWQYEMSEVLINKNKKTSFQSACIDCPSLSTVWLHCFGSREENCLHWFRRQCDIASIIWVCRITEGCRVRELGTFPCGEHDKAKRTLSSRAFRRVWMESLQRDARGQTTGSGLHRLRPPSKLGWDQCGAFLFFMLFWHYHCQSNTILQKLNWIEMEKMSP